MPSANELAATWTIARKPSDFLLRLWLSRFLTPFDSLHRGCLPARAARMLRHCSSQYRGEHELARRLGCSRSVLMRLFTNRYGLTPKAYHTRVRLRLAVLALRSTDLKVQYIANSVGYGGVANFYAAIEGRLGLRPVEIRELPDLAVERILNGELEINPARLFELRTTGQPNVGPRFVSLLNTPEGQAV